MAALKTVELRGFESIFVANPAATCMIAQVMTVQGPVQPLLDRLPNALAKTFNKHPRMRTKQSPTHTFQAQIEPFVTAQQLLEDQYFRVVFVDQSDEWQSRVCVECDQAYDRQQRFAFRLDALVPRVHSKPTKRNATQDREEGDDSEIQLVLYSDHYMSDALSSFAILHSILHEACAGDITTNDASDQVERTVPDSVYKIRGVWCNVKSLVAWILVKLLARPLIKLVASLYQPCLPIEASQQDSYSRDENPVRNKSF